MPIPASGLCRQADQVSNAQKEGKGKRKSSKLYKERGQREKNKARRIARDKARADLMDCGHGSRWQNRDNCAKCRRAERSL